MSKSTDHDEDEGEFIDAEEYLQHVLMNETKAYFDRGRRFEKLDVAQLNEKWVVVFKVYFADHTRVASENSIRRRDGGKRIRT